MKAEKWLFECRNLEEKFESVTKEKEVRLRSHRSSPTLSIKAQPFLRRPILPQVASCTCLSSGCWQSGTPCERPMTSCVAPSCSRGG